MHGFVVLADVVRSRQIEPRDEFRTTLTTALGAVNQQYDDQLIAEFEQLKGIDEFGGVLSQPDAAYQILREILDSVRPQKIRFALASGEISTNGSQFSVAQMDGEVFHRAADLLIDVESTGLWFDMELTHSGIGGLIADEINLLLEIRHRMTRREFQTIRAYEEYGTQTAAAKKLGITQQAVSEAVERSGWKLAQRVEQRLDTRIREL